MGIWNLMVFLPNQWKKKDAEERGRGEQRNANGFFGQHSRPSLELDCLDYIMDMFGDVKYGVCIHH